MSYRQAYNMMATQYAPVSYMSKSSFNYSNCNQIRRSYIFQN